MDIERLIDYSGLVAEPAAEIANRIMVEGERLVDENQEDEGASCPSYSHGVT